MTHAGHIPPIVVPLTSDQRVTIVRILNTIRSALIDIANTGKLDDRPLDASLAGGWSGVSLALASMARESTDSTAQAARAALARASMTLSKSLAGLSWWFGATGVAWTATHVSRLLGDSNDCDELSQMVDETLWSVVSQNCDWRYRHGFLLGLTGLGLYALERPHSDAALCALDRIVTTLSETAIHDASGCHWLTKPSLFRREPDAVGLEEFPDLGMASGVPGVVAFLSRVVMEHPTAVAADILDECVTWLLAQGLHDDRGCYGVTVRADRVVPPSAPGWCYGDPAIALALLAAADARSNSFWRQSALAIASVQASRASAIPKTRDASVCHGAAGIVHLYYRLFERTGDVTYVDATRLWLGRVIDLYDMNADGGGFKFYFTSRPINVPGLLRGIAGVGLVLSSIIGHTSLSWDRLLLVAPHYTSGAFGDPLPRTRDNQAAHDE